MPTDITLADLTARAVAFRDARRWKPYHTPRHLAANLCIEAAEVLEIFRWQTDQEAEQMLQTADGREALADELSDCLLTMLLMAHDQGINLPAAFEAKLRKTGRKYPADRP